MVTSPTGRRRLSRPLTLLLAAVGALCAPLLVVVGTASPAAACSCTTNSDAAFVRWADVIVTGTVTDVDTDGILGIGRDTAFYTVAVDGVLKSLDGPAGRVGDEVVVSSALSGASCGLEFVSEGRRYLFFADGSVRDPAALSASLCGGTGPATARRLDAVEARTGPAVAPAVAPDGADPSWGGRLTGPGGIAAAVVLAAGGTAAYVVRRRKLRMSPSGSERSAQE